MKTWGQIIRFVPIITFAFFSARGAAAGTTDQTPALAFEETPPPQIEFNRDTPLPEPTRPAADEARNIDLGKVASAMRAEQPTETDTAKTRQGLVTAQPRSPEVSYLKAAGALLFVLGLIVLSGYFLKKYSPRAGLLRGASLADIIGRIYLNPRATLHFVRTGGRVLVIGVTPTQINLVAEFDAAVFEETETANAENQLAQQDKKPRFAQLLAKFRMRAEEKATQPEPVLPDESLKALREEIVRLQHYVKEMSRGETNQ